MKQSTTPSHRQAVWRDRLARQAQSGQSVAAFCRSEGIAAHTFYWWRTRLAGSHAQAEPLTARTQAEAAAFIDLGALAPADSPHGIAAGFELRLDLPGGIALTIARR